MKHIMETSSGRELQLVGDLADALEDLEWSSEAWSKFATGARDEGLDRSMENAKPDPVSNLESHGTMVSIIILASIILGLDQPSVNFRQGSLSVRQHGVHGVCSS